MSVKSLIAGLTDCAIRANAVICGAETIEESTSDRPMIAWNSPGGLPFCGSWESRVVPVRAAATANRLGGTAADW